MLIQEPTIWKKHYGKGEFPDGEYKEGHGGADWTSRAKSGAILENQDNIDSIGGKIYNYEKRRLTLNKIMNDSFINKTTRAINYLNGEANPGLGVTSAESKATQELNDLLNEYTINSPIVSIAPGLVVKAEYNCYGGFTAGVVHNKTSNSRSARSSYVHMKRWPQVQVNDIVGAGTIVGYEGTTGNSGGNHLHMGLRIGGASDSPSEYMAPIFSPFFNKEKCVEVINEFSGIDNRLIMSSEYYSLVRTVLMEKVLDDRNREFYEIGEGIGRGEIPVLATASFSGDEPDLYVVFAASDLASGDKIRGYRPGGATKEIIVKVSGVSAPVYYKCKIEEPEEKAAPKSGDKIIYYLKVIEKEEINISDVVLSAGIGIKVDKEAYESKEVVWGNNVPLSPLVLDESDAYDITLLNTQRIYSGEQEYPAEEVDYEGEDVRASKDFFGEGSWVRDERNKLPVSMLVNMSDVNVAGVVPFYDGPIKLGQTVYESESNDWGIGKMSGDLKKLETAFVMSGLDTSQQIKIDGVFDEGMVTALQNEFIIKVGSLGGGFSIGAAGGGQLGNISSENECFDITTVVSWNSYLIYKKSSIMRQVAEEAINRAASIGISPNYIRAVAQLESGLIPQNESHKLLYVHDEDLPVIGSYDPALAVEGVYGNVWVVTWRGEKRVLRRAQGLMQITPGEGKALCAKEGITNVDAVIATIRTPYSNAFLAAKLLSTHMMDYGIRYRSEMNAAISSNPNWKKLRNATGTSELMLMKFAMASEAYNKGGVREAKAMDILNTMQFDGNSVTISPTAGVSDNNYAAIVLTNYVGNVRQFGIR